MPFHIQKIIDRNIGYLLCKYFGIFTKKDESLIHKPRKILIIRLWTIGESILTIPMIHELRKKYPKAQIDVLCYRSRKIFEMNKDIDNIIDFGANNFFKFKKYDLAIDTEPYLNISGLLSFWMAKKRIGFSHGARADVYNYKVKFNDRQHEVKTFIDLIKAIDDFKNIKYPEELVKLEVPEKYKRSADKFLKNKGFEKVRFIGVSAGVAESAKMRMWPTERFAKLCDKIIQNHKTKIVFFGAPEDYDVSEEIISLMNNKNKTLNSCGKLKLEEVIHAISKAHAFISNDSGLMHVSAAQKVRTLGLFGPNTPLRFSPYGKGNSYCYKGKNPIINVHKGEVPEQDNSKSMEKLSVEDVYDEFEKMLKEYDG